MLWPWPGSLGQTHNHRCCKISLYRTAKMKTMNKWRLIVHHANSLGNHCASWMACRAFILECYQKWDHLGYWEAIFCLNSVLFYIIIVSVHAFFHTFWLLKIILKCRLYCIQNDRLWNTVLTKQSVNYSEYVGMRYLPRRVSKSLSKPNRQYLALLGGYLRPTNSD